MVEAAVERGLSQPELWERIRVATLPRGFAGKTRWEEAKDVTFTDQLQKSYNLTDKSALRLVAEYRRYLYLKTLDGGQLSPSVWVDRAWHQHLEANGGEAWRNFCNEVLLRPVEHKTDLSSKEAKSLYARTFELYRKEFNEEPPKDIWPGYTEKRRQALGNLIFGFGLIVLILSVLFIFLSLLSSQLPSIVSLSPLFAGAVLLAIGWSLRGANWAPDPYFINEHKDEGRCA